jgi:hypothetical protein
MSTVEDLVLTLVGVEEELFVMTVIEGEGDDEDEKPETELEMHEELEELIKAVEVVVKEPNVHEDVEPKGTVVLTLDKYH